MPSRIYGIETEFGVLPVLKDERDVSKKALATGFLRNGSRYYLCTSGDHPEYATPECASVKDLVKYDKAGEIVAQTLSPMLKLYKNNLDYCGKHTFGCHENYLIKESAFSEDKLAPLIPFLVTRQIFTGAGFLEYYCDGTMKYNLSQRAAKIETEFNKDTTSQRPIVNLRDEPHTTIGKRLHLILGDTNMIEVATYLKVGTTSIVLDLLEDGLLGGILALDSPVSAMHRISEDQSHRWLVRTNGAKTIPAVDVQREYLARAQVYEGVDPGTDDLLKRWERVLDLLEKRDFSALARQVDWIAKKSLLEFYLDKEKTATVDKLRSLDLHYSSIDKEDSLYYALQEQNRVDRIVSDKEIEEAVLSPPRDTRAWIRGNLIGKKLVRFLDWSYIATATEKIDTNDPFNACDEKLEEILALHKT